MANVTRGSQARRGHRTLNGYSADWVLNTVHVKPVGRVGAEVLAAVPEVAASDALPVHFAGVPMTSRSANSVTESAFVQSPTHPPRKVFSS